MSYRIEFDYAAWRIPAGEVNMPEDQYLVASLGGDNNVISSSGAVARSWSGMCLGNHQQVIRQACDRAQSCEGGSLQLPGRRWIKPEAYIAKVRKLMETAPHISEGYHGEFFRKSFKIYEPKDEIACLQQSNPEITDRLYAFAKPVEKKDWYSEVVKLEWTFAVDIRQMAEFFAVFPFFIKNRYAWNFCSISGPGEK